MSHSHKLLSDQLPGVMLGGGVFNTQMNDDPNKLPIGDLIAKAFSVGINAIDTSPYYGPSEVLIGNALRGASIKDNFPRESYILATKVGRIALNDFDYSASWVHKSIERSLKRLDTSYLDMVYCHDVEFVTRDQVLEAFGVLIELQKKNIIRYIGISGFPPEVVTARIKDIKEKFGRAPDMVQNYAHFNLQNTQLEKYIDEWKALGVDCILNSSPLCMGLLSGNPAASFHPAPPGLRDRSMEIANWLTAEKGVTLADLSLKFVISKWAALGDRNGGGVLINGLSFLEELDHFLQVFDELRLRPESVSSDILVGTKWKVNEAKMQEYDGLFREVQARFGEWKDFSWDSPPADS